MKIQVACNILDSFLHEHDADILTREAFTALSAYARGLETKRSKAAAAKPPVTTTPPAAPPQSAPSPEVSEPADMPPAYPPRSGAGGSPWSKREDNMLKAEFYSCMSARTMAQRHERTIEAIAARLGRLGCINAREDLPGYTEYREAIARRRSGRG